MADSLNHSKSRLKLTADELQLFPWQPAGEVSAGKKTEGRKQTDLKPDQQVNVHLAKDFLAFDG